ncbi:DUF2199 domain-containing protein [Streptomyces sp. NPDC050560]|uniref:DUF2199 domain-containing protein n=1 Tax=Streptomyces sp. NPDC050560 TaxID=3365630 RepID=UPI0037B4815D
MDTHDGFICSRCGERHDELPFAYTALAPDVWDPAYERDPQSMLSSDQCVIRGEHYFLKGMIEIPVTGTDEIFSWGVWTSLSRENFSRAADLWNVTGREAEQPYFGWLTTDLAAYSPSTLNLRTRVHTRPVGQRPYVELEPTEHPLAVEQRSGMSRERVREIAESTLHGG